MKKEEFRKLIEQVDKKYIAWTELVGVDPELVYDAAADAMCRWQKGEYEDSRNIYSSLGWTRILPKMLTEEGLAEFERELYPVAARYLMRALSIVGGRSYYKPLPRDFEGRYRSHEDALEALTNHVIWSNSSFLDTNLDLSAYGDNSWSPMYDYLYKRGWLNAKYREPDQDTLSMLEGMGYIREEF